MNTISDTPSPQQLSQPNQAQQGENDAPLSQEEIDEIFKEIANMLTDQKMSVSEVVGKLVEQGADAQVATEMVNGVMSAIEKEYMKGIMWGIVWAAGGLIVTYIGYESASNGGTYTVFYGAVLYGAYLFLRSIIGLMSLKR